MIIFIFFLGFWGIWQGRIELEYRCWNHMDSVHSYWKWFYRVLPSFTDCRQVGLDCTRLSVGRHGTRWGWNEGFSLFEVLFLRFLGLGPTDWSKVNAACRRGESCRLLDTILMAFATQDLGGCATGFCGGYRRWPPTPVAGTGRRRRRSGKPSPPTSTSDHRRHRLRCRTCNLPARRLPPTATRGRQSWRHDRPTGRGSAIEKKKNNSFRPPPHRLSPPLDARNVVHRLRLFLSLSPFSVAPFFVFSFSFTKSKRFLRRSRTSFRSGSLHSASPLMDSSNRISTDDVTIPTTPQWPFIQFNFRFDDKKRTPMFFFHFWWRWSIFHIKSFEPISITKFLLKKNISFITASELHWILWRSYWVCLPKLRLSTTFWKKNVIPHFVIIF